jgi:N4-gp56 family major capsid protein
MSTTIVFGPGTTPQAGGSIPAEVRQMYLMKLLRAAEPKLIHAQFMDDEPIPQGTGTTMIMRRWELLGTYTTQLSEGVTPTSDQPTVTPVSVTVGQYGTWMAVTDVMTWVAIDKVMSMITERQGFQASMTIDLLARAIMNAGTGVQYANSRVSRVTVQQTDKISAIEIKKSVRTLDTAYVERFDDGCFVIIVHPFTVFDVEAISDWQLPHQYADGQQSNIYKGEIGMLYGLRFVVSPLAQVFPGQGAAGADVYGSIVFGKNAFVKSEISGQSLQHIIKPLGAGDDALNQRATSGWKATFGGTRANETFAVRIEHGCST